MPLSDDTLHGVSRHADAPRRSALPRERFRSVTRLGHGLCSAATQDKVDL
jgi:hypothetical protein